MRAIFLILYLFTFHTFGQVTPNPSIEKKSAQNVFINKIEITEEYTVFHMQFYDKSDEKEFDKFMDENPDLARRLHNMGMDRDEALKFFRQRLRGEQTISFQPGSQVVLPNGQTFKFIKASNIPVAPERKAVEPGKKYFFKVYFERIPAGFEKIDLIEYEYDKEGTYQYWNFKGIKINNPKDRKPAVDTPVEVLKPEDFRVYGKVMDAVSGKTLNAKIRVISGTQRDSLQTSRTGKYEFLVNDEELDFSVEATGYEPLKEKLNIKVFLKSGSFQKDFFLEPSQSIEREPQEAVGEQVEESTFKLDKVYFNVGQAQILPESYEQLSQLVQYLKVNPTYKIQIEGHTDNQGDARANLQLSNDRAYNVRQYLIEQGIETSRIKFKGYGSSKPVSPNDTEENRRKNRRVEYQIIKEE
ncbi:OmpA/MotB domain protein [Leadbetterella byssophila DSM 17132]|uniref:OmpA/MotB domain protein n=1 Tax=Leadbetterella byssophila (strain DSM 17132 / JCM 16389 / KACC 11308 / NBRC 106382 / 4M15) TaxID=649349 RepID=E4RUY3_LEAB4|nr:OmpA family protein [Leadbetterella byssophila]ADQ17006.1 OmpA/MotB domain protein [Leadbetterella byssophila DSM 17132]